VNQLFIDFKEVYNSVRREVLYNIIIEFGVSTKQARLINNLTERYNRVWVRQNLSDVFSIRNGLKN